VVIENFRPGVMDALGLGAASMCERDPRLVYCSLPGFAADDPRAAMPAWERDQAATGTYRLPRGRPRAPAFTAIPSSRRSRRCSQHPIAAALISREHDRRGRIEVPLFDATFGDRREWTGGGVPPAAPPDDFGGGLPVR
jgi:crotonobetainyl-CoA:carnitine CoA-transferase CaiB-like acyl-CoA transferase